MEPMEVEFGKSSDTSDKLREARYFLDQAKANEQKIIFNYYLNAFIGSGRSVLWVMNAEYSKVPGWKAWYEAKHSTSDEEQILKQMTDLRNTSQKRAPLKTRHLIEITLPADHVTPEVERHLNDSLGKSGTLTMYGPEKPPADAPGTPFRGTIDRVSRVLVAGGGPIADVCEAYYEILEGWVSECDSLFSKAAERAPPQE